MNYYIINIIFNIYVYIFDNSIKMYKNNNILLFYFM